uniref:Serrate RNA effector molecule homolog n=1 Tax=Ditylenchus dipsaci TaxID=166011 RepID=A0A915CNK4_9BILA
MKKQHGSLIIETDATYKLNLLGYPVLPFSMPESDEDFERVNRNRDKFVRERDYGGRMHGRETYNMDRSRRDYSNGVGGGIKRGMPNRREEEPIMKRNRFDAASDSFEPAFVRKEENSTPVMLTFKKFLCTQDESLSDEEAITKYKEYKLEFKKQECEKYFQAHKDEEWFRLKYHPEESRTFKEEQKAFLDKRLQIFNNILEGGLISRTNLDYENAANIIRLMDTVVIKLEDGADEAINAMNQEEIEDESISDLAKLTEAKLKKTKVAMAKKTPRLRQSLAETQAAVKAELDDSCKPKKAQFHRTCSIFFRNIPANVKIEEIENLCKQHPGFLRIGLTDPLTESFQRRGWVTFRRDVNIKEIFWAMKNAKLGGSDLGALVNRDLKRRIRSVNGVTLHRVVAQNDIRQASKLIVLYDHKANLYSEDQTQDSLNDLENAIVKSQNPILKGVFEYLVEEASAEEDELLGNNEKEETDIKSPLEVDRNLLKVLDKLILYLRIVHSVDYYNHGEYPNEDTMPNRIEYEDKAVEEFVTANCVELAKDKWLCPLSGKKFKGPEFIQKHLQSKHQDKLDEVRHEVLYFNNYLIDPLRPHNPESKTMFSTPTLQSPGNPMQSQQVGIGQEDRRSQDFENRNAHGRNGNWQGNDRGINTRYIGHASGRGFLGGNRDFNKPRYFDPNSDGRRDPRQQTSYRDLDAPEEIFEASTQRNY